MNASIAEARADKETTLDIMVSALFLLAIASAVIKVECCGKEIRLACAPFVAVNMIFLIFCFCIHECSSACLAVGRSATNRLRDTALWLTRKPQIAKACASVDLENVQIEFYKSNGDIHTVTWG